MDTRVRLGFSRGRHWYSRAICAVTGASVSHVFFLVERGGERVVYEASPSGFQSLPWERWERMNDILEIFDMDWEHQGVRDALDSMLGTPYDYFEILASLFKIKLRRWGRPWRLWGASCVTMTEDFFKRFLSLDVSVLTPLQLLLFVKSLKK